MLARARRRALEVLSARGKLNNLNHGADSMTGRYMQSQRRADRRPSTPWAVYKIEADKGDSDQLATLLERESLALRCVAARRAHTAMEIAAKAALLAEA